ncbi:2,3-diphosphoglycerate-dependent phosphoglycerate mutase [Immundisolibacter sp.]|uniref:2,3-bisphosphoglycerate-dependent phosphoglycerate mutase n=1 Tax=Immundisolibacter sp. TaxID=1934948 RepID=UPI0035614700
MTATLILIRHGRSLWNEQNRFTGWVDVPLTERGWREAETAGRQLAEYRFDVAYTSHLQRAICTLQVVLRANRSGRTPIFLPAEGTVPRESYQPVGNEFPVHLHVTALAERHYGDLQGLNKDQVLAEYGQEQFVKWRRGYDTPPPNGESLKDTVARALPYFDTAIRPRLLDDQTVLISAHGNSLRALTKDLENISDTDIVGLEIPTGVPIVYRLDTDGQALRIVDKRVLEHDA